MAPRGRPAKRPAEEEEADEELPVAKAPREEEGHITSQDITARRGAAAKQKHLNFAKQ